MTRYHKSLMHYKNLKDRRRQQEAEFRPLQVHVLWGPPGTGKSRLAREMTAGAPTATVHLTGTATAPSWWDSYGGEPNVIIDDFLDTQLSRASFCQIFDGYPCDLAVKGSFKVRQFTTVVITTNQNPADWYFGDRAVARRITSIKEMITIDDISDSDALALDPITIY